MIEDYAGRKARVLLVDGTSFVDRIQKDSVTRFFVIAKLGHGLRYDKVVRIEPIADDVPDTPANLGHRP